MNSTLNVRKTGMDVVLSVIKTRLRYIFKDGRAHFNNYSDEGNRRLFKRMFRRH